jgi:hypothetical protein
LGRKKLDIMMRMEATHANAVENFPFSVSSLVSGHISLTLFMYFLCLNLRLYFAKLKGFPTLQAWERMKTKDGEHCLLKLTQLLGFHNWSSSFNIVCVAPTVFADED